MRLYLLQTAEKGIDWLRLVAHGRAGHGSQINDDNAVTRLAEAVAADRRARLADARSRRRSAQFLDGSHRGDRRRVRPGRPGRRCSAGSAPWPGSSVRRCATPRTRRCSRPATSTTSSRRPPRRSSTAASCPATRSRLLATIRELVGRDVDVEVLPPRHRRSRRPSTAPSSTRWSRRCRPRTRAPGCCPTACPAARTTRRSACIGIRGFGFAPLQLPPELDFAGMFHGIDERVPLDALRFGTRVLGRFLATC